MIQASERFNEIANGSVRPLDWDCNISFTKERDDDRNWFILNSSKLNGNDLLSMSEEQPMQLWDFYKYENYKDRLMSLSISRSIQFPYSVQSAIADITLDNHDGLFSVNNEDSPLDGHILPSRPIRLYLGFKDVENVPQFVGLTESIPQYSGLNNTTASLTAMDFLSSIGDMSLKASIMLKDASTDEAIEIILQQFGLDSSMYSLDKGNNIIPFLYLEKGKNAGNALSDLVLAENGKLWLSETGIIRFSPRTSDLGKVPVMMFDADSIVEYKPSFVDGIYNRVKIKSEIRKVQQNQPIFSADNENGYQDNEDTYRVKAGTPLEVWLTLDDPAWVANIEPVLNGSANDSHFTAKFLDGSFATTGIIAQGTLFANSIKMVFTNTTDRPVSISFLQIWGQPAKVVDTIDYDAYDDESVEKYGERVLEIQDNDFFGSYSNVDKFATKVLNDRAKYSPDCTLRVKDNPALQIDDIIQVDWKGIETYRIHSISRNLTQKGLLTQLGLERYKVILPFTLDVSTLNGEDLLA